jgi:hypothetical protein
MIRCRVWPIFSANSTLAVTYCLAVTSAPFCVHVDVPKYTFPTHITNILSVSSFCTFMIVCRSLCRKGVFNSPNLKFYRSISRTIGTVPMANGDLNNTAAARTVAEITADAAYRNVSLAIPVNEDDAHIRKTYRPFLLDSAHAEQDWIARLELSTALKMVESQILKSGGERLRILVLHGSMRTRYISRLP